MLCQILRVKTQVPSILGAPVAPRSGAGCLHWHAKCMKELANLYYIEIEAGQSLKENGEQLGT